MPPIEASSGGCTEGQAAAQAALLRAERARRTAESRAREVSETAERLRDLRERNHFAEMIRLSLGGQ